MAVLATYMWLVKINSAESGSTGSGLSQHETCINMKTCRELKVGGYIGIFMEISTDHSNCYIKVVC